MVLRSSIHHACGVTLRLTVGFIEGGIWLKVFGLSYFMRGNVVKVARF